MTAPERICVVNCGLPADQCVCYRVLMNEAYPLVTIDPSILAADLARVTAELKVTDYLLLAETQLSLDRLARADAAEAKVARLQDALERLLSAVSGPTGFAEAVRHNSGTAYPWPSLDAAEVIARAALSDTKEGG